MLPAGNLLRPGALVVRPHLQIPRLIHRPRLILAANAWMAAI